MQNQNVVAERALALGLIALRSQYENGVSRGQDQETKSKWRSLDQEIVDWARNQNVEAFLSRKELELHKKGLGEWTGEDIGERFWRIESLKAVLWCIQFLDRMPSYSEVGSVRETYNKLPVGRDITPFLTKAKLRHDHELEKERHFAEFLHWRCMTEMLRLQGMRAPAGDNYEKVVARALPAIAENRFPIQHDGTDILVNGVRFIDLGEAKGDMMSICYERHLALTWVLSDDGWDEARADT